VIGKLSVFGSKTPEDSAPLPVWQTARLEFDPVEIDGQISIRAEIRLSNEPTFVIVPLNPEYQPPLLEHPSSREREMDMKIRNLKANRIQKNNRNQQTQRVMEDGMMSMKHKTRMRTGQYELILNLMGK
jgi:hypothetical protein